MNLKEQFEHFKKEFIIPVFKEADFEIKRSNTVYFRVLSNGVHQMFCLIARGNRKNDPNWTFTFEFGVIPMEPVSVEDLSASFDCRFGYLTRGHDSWHYLEEDNYQQLGELVSYEITQYALPLFNHLKDKESIERLRQLRNNTDSGDLSRRLREIFPDFGRDYIREYYAILENTVYPILAKAGFEKSDEIFYRTVRNVVQVFCFKTLLNNNQTMFILEGLLGFYVQRDGVPIPALTMTDPDWLLISTTYVVTQGAEQKFSRYDFKKYAPMRISELIGQDLENHVLPYFDELGDEKTVEAMRTYLNNRKNE